MSEQGAVTPDTSQEDTGAKESMQDTLAATLAEIESRDSETPSEPSKPEPETDESESDDQAEAEDESDESEGEEPETTEEEEEDAGEIGQEVPVSVPKALREKFLSMPEELQELYRKRDDDIEGGIKKYAESAKYGDDLKKVIEPFRQAIQAAGAKDDQTVVHNMLSLDSQLRYGTEQQKTLALQNLAKYYGVEMASSNGSNQDESEDDDYTDPEIKALKAKIAELESAQKQSAQSVEEQRAMDAQQQILAFENEKDAKGNLKHPHFEKVKESMGKLITAGLADDLPSAYKKAVSLDPDISEKVNKIAKLDKKIKASKDAKRKINKGKPATYTDGASVAKADHSNKSVRNTLEDAYRDIQARSM